MITVATVSQAEAQVADRALHDAVPPEMGYEVYLLGKLFAGRQPAAAPWPEGFPEELR